MIDAEDPFRLAPGALRCPYPHYEALREQGATVWSEELAAFVISGHEHAAATLRQPDVASSRRPTGPGLAVLTAAAIDRCRARGQLSELAEAHLRAPTPRTVFTIDPPEHGATDADVVQMIDARAEMATFFADHLQRARRDPANDLVTALIDAVDDNGRALTEGERIGLLINFLVAGNETSIKATAATIRVLAEHPSIWAALKADRTKVPNFLEEVLRLEPPTQGMFRFLAADLEIEGTTLPAGADVYVNFAAADRDPAVFPAPTEIVLDRPHPMRHLAFGQGPHTCLGAWLARLEITAGIDAMLDHVAAISLAPGNTFEHEPSYLLHGLQRLDVDVVAERDA